MPCKGCYQAYISETARNLGYRLDEHQKDVNSKANVMFTRSHRKSSQTEFDNSAITDHASQNNHVIDWENFRIVDKDSNTKVRLIKESIWIRKERAAMNRDEGAFKLDHSYDSTLTTLTPGGQQQLY